MSIIIFDRAMDISVSRLNKRMALQLPAEFPLGLVFVVGIVQKPSAVDDDRNIQSFYLSEGDHLLFCRLSERAASENHLEEGDLIRAGGHLAFEPTQAAYYLLARDIEILSDPRPARSYLDEIIADKAQRNKKISLVPAELPSWVEQLAPPEIRRELEEQKKARNESDVASGDGWELFAEAETSLVNPLGEPALAGLSDELISFLSEAMDSEDEVELTPQLLAKYETGTKSASLSAGDLEALHELESALAMTIFQERTVEEKINTPPESEAVDEVLPDKADPIQEQPVEDPPDKAHLAQPAKASEERRAVPRPKPAPTSKGQAAVIPWYIVALFILVFLFFVALLFIVAMNSNFLPVPISLPG